MNDKEKLYIVLAFMTLVSFLNLFLFKVSQKWIIAIVLCLFAVIVGLLIKAKKSLDIEHRQILIFLVVFSAVVLLVQYLLGIKFGYGNSTYKGYYAQILLICCSLVVIYFCCEFIRYKVITFGNLFQKIIFTINMICVEIFLVSSFANITSLNNFMFVFGLGLCSGITKNLLFNSLVTKYGIMPNFAYATITSVYAYIMPVLPKLDDMFLVLINLVAPVIIFLLIRAIFGKKKFVITAKKKTLNNSIFVVFLGLVLTFILLVSCRFKYCMLVIGSDSMTGTINKGDAILYSTDYGTLKIGDVIVFKKNGVTIIHRIKDLETVEGELLIYTKGDANEADDPGYITEGSMVGKYLFKIPFLGWPTIFVNNLFK